ncbi:trigger factor [Selenomonadales bacterium OttesenSCG-928-I06]|nr:trigger factor [Selenomonadales bacterium OttesenSCG-928-I06]
MKVTSERIDNHKIVFNFEIPQNVVAKEVESAYKRIAGKVNIPGFRKGKAPRKIIERQFGMQMILDEAFEKMASDAYREALKQEDVEPVTQPEVDIETLEEDKPAVFKATVVVKPEVVLGDYRGLTAEKKAVEVTDEDVAKELEKMREYNAKLVVVEEGATLDNGDMAVIDYEGFVDDVAFEGGKGASYPLQIGSGTFIPGFEEQLIGAKAGEEKEVNVKFPDEYHSEELKGKDAKFIVKIQDIKRKELPELNDDFAKEVSSFETLDELKADVKEKLKAAMETKSRDDYNNALIQTAIDNAEFGVPDVMVENQINSILESFEYNLTLRGVNLDLYLKQMNLTIEQLRENYREPALKEVKRDLVLGAIAKKEELVCTEQDLKFEIEKMAASYQTTPAEVRKAIQKTGRISALVDTVLRKKVYQLIFHSAKDEANDTTAKEEASTSEE